MHGQNIDSFLRRFNDPQTAETFNESAAAPAACLRLLREMLLRRRLHFFCACRKLPRQLLPRLAISISLVPLLPLPLLLLLLLLFCCSFRSIHNLAALSCQHILCATNRNRLCRDR